MLAFTFPGQGSQRPGMGQAWIEHPSWELVRDASAVAGRDLEHLLLEAEAEELTQTRNAQLSTFVLSLVVLDAVERVGIEPAFCAGHSLGEYTALVAAGAIGFEDGVRVVVERGEAMQVAAEDQPGTMAAIIGVDDDLVDVACRRADGDVWVANYNAPGQVVIAGSHEAVGRAGEIAKEQGAKRVLPLPVSGAFHTPYMGSARNRLRKALTEASFRDPEVAVVANVDAQSHDEADEWSSLLSAQLCSPVRWRQSLLQIREQGVGTLVELGPGGVLTGLARRTVPEVTGISIASPDDIDTLVEIVAGETALSSYVHERHGEHLYVSERLVVSPVTGLWAPLDDAEGTAIGEPVEVGTLIGRVGGEEVRSPFDGTLMGVLALPGERVTAGQPVAWLRTA